MIDGRAIHGLVDAATRSLVVLFYIAFAGVCVSLALAVALVWMLVSA